MEIDDLGKQLKNKTKTDPLTNKKEVIHTGQFSGTIKNGVIIAYKFEISGK